MIPVVMKSALVLAQTNADSEHSLSVNTRIITDDRSLLGEKTIIGLHIVKEAVWFFDPVSSQPERIPIDIKLKKSVRAAHASYREHLEKEKEIERKKKEDEAKQKEMTEKQKEERTKLLKKKESLAKSGEDLHEQKRKAREDLKVADELLKDAKAKLSDVLSSETVNKSSLSVANMMLETATIKHEEAR